MASEITYCLCGQPYDANRFMIQCDMCRDWFHGSCVGIKEFIAAELDKYHCPRCEVTYGPSKFKEKTNWHRHNPNEVDAEKKPVQTGTPLFIKELKSRHFAPAEEAILLLSGEELTLKYLQDNGFDKPILIPEKEGLNMTVPPSEFTVWDVMRHIGEDREVDVIDVTRQADIHMKLHDFVEYFASCDRSKILNLISLEFTNTGLARIVEAPVIARELDWVNYVWPSHLPEDVLYQKPEVQKYCLMGVEDSYTDFHIDFGGSSVWYHILKGEKVFYLIRPTPANLSLYQRWMASSTRSETFFGDQVDTCYKCIMRTGQTMLIPTGWIHAVLTPVDSLVFGGNFLHSLNIPMQLQSKRRVWNLINYGFISSDGVYEIEKKIHTPEKFCFPAFETTNWYAARALLNEMRQLNNQGRMLPSYLLIGVKALILTLKQWNHDKEFPKFRREPIPVDVESQKLLKELSKEVRHAERFMNTLNPPKPERESKRKKKKPVNEDFVDFSEPQESVAGDLRVDNHRRRKTFKEVQFNSRNSKK